MGSKQHPDIYNAIHGREAAAAPLVASRHIETMLKSDLINLCSRASGNLDG